ncbi:MAG: glycosyltransferase family 2 protein [Lachnospiraceae bacterium]|nr:glycosyltransferase family 2 protein [Lachnospiraceae bacterium]
MLVSIIIPLYNVNKYIDSIVSNINIQTYKNIEVIFVDDGSTDGTLEMLKHKKINVNNVIYLQQENSGPSVARNKGLDVAQGEYIVFWDADDYVSEKAIEDLVGAIKNNDLGMITIFMRFINNEKIVDNKLSIDMFQNNNDFKESFAHLLSTNHMYAIPLWNKIYKKDIIHKYHIKFCEGLSWSEDLDWNVQYYNYVNNWGLEKNSGYYYCIRKNNENLSRKYDSKNIFTLYKTLNKMLMCVENRQMSYKEFCYMWCIKNAVSNIANVFRNKNVCFFANVKFIKKYFFNELYAWCKNAKAQNIYEKILLLCIKNRFKNGIVMIAYVIHIVREFR